MPASDTGGTQTPAGARAIVEPLGLDAGSLGDGDYSALSLQHSNSQYTNAELETLVNLQAELDRLQTVDGSLSDELCNEGSDVIVTSEETVESCVEIDGTTHEIPEETILPDITDETLCQSSLKVENVALTTEVPVPVRRTVTSRPMTIAAKTPQGQSIVLIQSPSSSSSGTPTVTSVSLGSGQTVTKLTSLTSNLTSSSFVTKSVDGRIVQLRPAGLKSTMATGISNNLQGLRPLQAAVKRPATTTTGSIRNVVAKVIITGNQGGQQAQPVIVSASQSQNVTTGQPIKIVSGTGSQTLINSPTRAITFAQAQQMGLIPSSKMQQLLPSSSNKQVQGGVILNKVVGGSPVKSAGTPKIVMQSSALKSPTKILPAPVTNLSQLKPTSPNATVTAVTTGNSTILTSSTSKPLLSPNKVIIRQGLKPGTLISNLGTSQVLRIPASQTLSTGTNVTQIQMQGGKQVQYLRVMNPNAATSINKPRMVSVTSVSSHLKPVAIRTGVPSSQQSAVRVVPIAPATSSVRAVAPKSIPGQRLLIPAGVTPTNQIRSVSANQLRGITTKSILPATSSNVTYVVPAQYVQQVRNQVLQGQTVATPPATSLLSTPSPAVEASGSAVSTSPDALPLSPPRPPQPARTSVEPNGIRPRKPCNCTKSQCLKLYCDCFANGEFCFMCNCNNCFNNLQHEEDRQAAIKSCLERNPNAFRPKIGKGHVGDERRHNKGCNCKRSGCLKNYCECYEAKIPCSNNCKCVGCRNLEESDSLRSSLRELADVAESRVLQQIIKKENLAPNIDKTSRPFVPTPLATSKQPFSFMTQAVVKATVECLLASAEEAELNELSDDVTERLMIEELGRCLIQVIRCSDKADAAYLESGKGTTGGNNAST